MSIFPSSLPMKKTPGLDKDHCPTVYLFAVQLDSRRGPLLIKKAKAKRKIVA